MVLPLKILTSGTAGHKIAAVYAIKNSNYKRGSDGWEHCEFVGVTRDLDKSLKSHQFYKKTDQVAHVRALSFSFPQKGAMEEVAATWKKQAEEAGATLGTAGVNGWVDGWGEDVDRQELVDLIEQTAFYDDDDDDDEFDDDEDELSMGEVTAALGTKPVAGLSAGPPPSANDVVSPFESDSGSSSSGKEALVFSPESVDKVLEEVRPYLISDGGNVSVQRVDEETKNVYLVLEGACGSCPSSTVTMQMGIERVLKENFPDLGEVIQVEDPATAAAQPTELEWQAVEDELSRIRPAITAMGGVIQIVSVDPIGVVELKFQGPNKLRQGIELAVKDVPFVKHINFVM
mmetsp:Transcript_18801/g.24659  ORF Transcript_18801/g.24659 Transcript_18801/m.24659 type:complete len:345 (+) Transcript_18801:1-1035(+)